MRPWRYVLCLGGVAVAALFAAWGVDVSRDKQARERLSQVHLGMSMAEVESVTGRPLGVNHAPDSVPPMEIWVFYSALGSSQGTQHARLIYGPGELWTLP